MLKPFCQRTMWTTPFLLHTLRFVLRSKSMFSVWTGVKFKPFWKSFKSNPTFQLQWHLVSPYFIALDRKERWRYSQWNTTRLVSYKTVTGSGPQLCGGALHIGLFWLYFVQWEFSKHISPNLTQKTETDIFYRLKMIQKKRVLAVIATHFLAQSTMAEMTPI